MPPFLSGMLDILRLVAIPVFVWAAYKDIKTRRVNNRPWLFLAGLGVLLLAIDGFLVEFGYPTHRYPPTFWRTVAISVFGVVPFAYLAWLLGLFGGADAKALMALAILFPVTPSYAFTLPFFDLELFTVPEYTFPISIFAFTIFANAILLSMLYPAVMVFRNIFNRDFSTVMFLSRPLPLRKLETAHGVLFETTDGHGRGADLDVIRNYLDWRNTDLQSLEPVTTTTDSPDNTSDTVSAIERWSVDAFFEETDTLTYGMTPETVAEGLELVHTRREDTTSVWVSPGIPYMVPFAVGLCVAVTYGNLMIALLILLQ